MLLFAPSGVMHDTHTAPRRGRATRQTSAPSRAPPGPLLMLLALLSSFAVAADAMVVLEPNATHCHHRETYPCDRWGAGLSPACWMQCPPVHAEEVRRRMERRFAWEFVYQDEALDMVGARVISYLRDIELGTSPTPPTFHFVGRSGSGKTLAAEVIGWALSQRRGSNGGTGCGVVPIHMISYATTPVEEAVARIKSLLIPTFSKCKVGVVLLDDVGTVPELQNLVVSIVHRALLHPTFDGASLDSAVVIMTSDFGVGRTADIATEVQRMEYHNDWRKEKLAIQRIAKHMEIDFTTNTRLAETTWIVPFRPLRRETEFLELLKHYLLNKVACAHGVPIRFDDNEMYLLVDDWLEDVIAASNLDMALKESLKESDMNHQTIATARAMHESLIKNAITPLLVRGISRIKGSVSGHIAEVRYTHVGDRPDETVKEGISITLKKIEQGTAGNANTAQAAAAAANADL